MTTGQEFPIWIESGKDRVDTHLGKEIWIGDPLYGDTIQSAVTAIGSTECTLRIPPGAWAITSYLAVPANITLKFENGAYIDLSGLMDAPIEALASSGGTTEITVTGHGLVNGDKVKFYGITQTYVSGATHVKEWMGLNDRIYTITKTGDNTFTTTPAINSSTWHSYVPATDPGKVCVPVTIKGQVVAGKQKIFNVAGPCQIGFSDDYASTVAPTNPRNQVTVYPEWFGAVGDGTTDDLLALDASFHSLKYADKAFGTIYLTKFYAVTSTWSLNEIGLNEFGQFNVLGIGRNTSGIVGTTACTDKPVVEGMGSACLRLEHFGVYGTATGPLSAQPAGAPSVGLLLGASQTTISTAGSVFNDLYFYGWFKIGTVANRGHAQSQFTNIETYVAPWTSGTPSYAFDFYFAAGERTLPWAALQPTNSAWNTWTTNRDCGGTVLDVIKTATQTYANQLTGSACIYLDKASPLTMNHILIGGGMGYFVKAQQCSVNMQNAGGDGYGTIAGVYIDLDSGGYIQARLTDVTNNKAGGTVLQTGSNASLSDSTIIGLAGNNGCKIILGNGAINSRFTGLHILQSFINTGTFNGNTVEVDLNCLILSGVTGYGNTVKRIMYNGNFTYLDGDLHLGYPGQTVPSSLFIEPYKMTWSSVAPAAGSWAQGSVIWKIGAAVNTSPGWNCRLDNTFGTLNGGATTGTITTGTKLLTVNSVTDLTVGNFIDVVADGGGNAVTAGRIVNIDSTNKIVTLYANATATAGAVTPQLVSFHNHTTAEAFEAMPSTLARTSGVTGAIATGTTVTHGLGVTPTKVLLTSVDGVPTGIYPDALGATTFAINFAGGGNHAFYWEAIQ